MDLILRGCAVNRHASTTQKAHNRNYDITVTVTAHVQWQELGPEGFGHPQLLERDPRIVPQPDCGPLIPQVAAGL